MAGIDFLINSVSGDIDLSNNTITLVSSIEQLVKQKIEITLRAYRGEWEFNISFGIPYLKNSNNLIQLLGVGDNKRLLDFEIRDAILGKEEILSIISFNSVVDKPSRTYTLTFEAETEEGPILFDSELNI